MKRKKRHPILLSCLAASLLLVIWTAWANTHVSCTQLTIQSEGLPAAFSGLTIAHVSDLHNVEFGPGNQQLLQLLHNAQPDLIAITGDLVDSRRTDLAIAAEFARAAAEIAPVYYVTGNHEGRIADYPQLEASLLDAGVTVLHDQGIQLQRDGDSILILGLNDPSFSGYSPDNSPALVAQTLQDLLPQSDGFTLLLSHRPELFETYAAQGIDLVLSGHAHGGQVRIPFVGGLIAPDQGFLPKYDAGLFQTENTSMVVSRGLGNSLFPFRVNNPPELVLITLE